MEWGAHRMVKNKNKKLRGDKLKTEKVLRLRLCELGKDQLGSWTDTTAASDPPFSPTWAFLGVSLFPGLRVPGRRAGSQSPLLSRPGIARAGDKWV